MIGVTVTAAALAAMLNWYGTAAVPNDVQAECEDHRAVFRQVQGTDLVYDCELQEWFAEVDWIAADDGQVNAGVMQQF